MISTSGGFEDEPEGFFFESVLRVVGPIEGDVEGIPS